MELSSYNIKKILIFSQKKGFLIFSQKKAFLRFPEMEPCAFQPKLEQQKNPPIKISLFQETEAPKQLFIFSQKKPVLMFQEKGIPKKFFIFYETSYISGNRTLKPQA